MKVVFFVCLSCFFVFFLKKKKLFVSTSPVVCVSSPSSLEDGEEERLISNQQKTHADMQTRPERGGQEEVWLYVNSHKSTSVMNTHTLQWEVLFKWTLNPQAERNLHSAPLYLSTAAASVFFFSFFFFFLLLLFYYTWGSLHQSFSVVF